MTFNNPAAFVSRRPHTTAPLPDAMVRARLTASRSPWRAPRPLPSRAQATPVATLIEELREAERRVDDVEENLAVATDALAELFEFQRRERWREHHDVLLRLGQAIESAGPESVDSASLAYATAALERELATGVLWLEEVRAEMGECTRCGLSEERTHIVFGDGNPHLELERSS